jgi:uncharacterized integral membrane protein
MNRRKLALQTLGGAIAVVVLGWFAYANGGQSVDLHFGLFTLRDVSLPVVVYGSVIVGMLLVVGVSWRSDLRAQQALKKYDQIAAKAMAGVPPAADERVEQKAEPKS